MGDNTAANTQKKQNPQKRNRRLLRRQALAMVLTLTMLLSSSGLITLVAQAEGEENSDSITTEAVGDSESGGETNLETDGDKEETPSSQNGDSSAADGEEVKDSEPSENTGSTENTGDGGAETKDTVDTGNNSSETSGTTDGDNGSSDGSSDTENNGESGTEASGGEEPGQEAVDETDVLTITIEDSMNWEEVQEKVSEALASTPAAADEDDETDEKANSFTAVSFVGEVKMRKSYLLPRTKSSSWSLTMPPPSTT